MNKIIQAVQEFRAFARDDPKFSTDAQQNLVHQKGCYTCQTLHNVEMYKYAKCYQISPCGSRVISVFNNCFSDILNYINRNGGFGTAKAPNPRA